MLDAAAVAIAHVDGMITNPKSKRKTLTRIRSGVIPERSAGDVASVVIYCVLSFRQPPARLLATICLSIAARGRA